MFGKKKRGQNKLPAPPIEVFYPCHGFLCRTDVFIQPINTQDDTRPAVEFLEAEYQPENGEYKLWRYSAKLMQVQGKKSRVFDKIPATDKETLPFSQILEHMASFENGQQQMEHEKSTPILRSNQQDIPHFKDYAIANGLIIDIHGRPHEIRNNRPATGSQFDEESLRQAENFTSTDLQTLIAQNKVELTHYIQQSAPESPLYYQQIKELSEIQNAIEMLYDTARQHYEAAQQPLSKKTIKDIHAILENSVESRLTIKDLYEQNAAADRSQIWENLGDLIRLYNIFRWFALINMQELCKHIGLTAQSWYHGNWTDCDQLANLIANNSTGLFTAETIEQGLITARNIRQIYPYPRAFVELLRASNQAFKERIKALEEGRKINQEKAAIPSIKIDLTP